MEIEQSQQREPQTLIEKIQYHAAGVTLLVLTAIMVYVIVMRYAFNRPPLWGEEVPRVIFIWMTFLFAGIAIRLNLNIAVVAVINKVPPAPRRLIQTVMHVLVLILLAIMIWYSLLIVDIHSRGHMLSTGWSNMVFSLPIPIGSAIMAFYQARRLIDLWRTAA
jgi:TRAP-type C4-dicarboxylate transport system permease small subunit